MLNRFLLLALLALLPLLWACQPAGKAETLIINFHQFIEISFPLCGILFVSDEPTHDL